MIYFDKITPYQSDIKLKRNGKTIGTMEILANTYYLIEIDYFSFEIQVNYKKNVKHIIEHVYKEGIKREYRERKPFRPYKDFKILE